MQQACERIGSMELLRLGKLATSLSEANQNIREWILIKQNWRIIEDYCENNFNLSSYKKQDFKTIENLLYYVLKSFAEVVANFNTFVKRFRLVKYFISPLQS